MSQGDQMMARKLAAQQQQRLGVSGASDRQSTAGGSSRRGSISNFPEGPPPPDTPPSPSLPATTLRRATARQSMLQGGVTVQWTPPAQAQAKVDAEAAESRGIAEQAKAAREKHSARHNLESTRQRQAVYEAWPDDKHYLQQQLALIRQELAEKDEQLSRANSEVRLLTSEVERQRRLYDSEVYKIKSENLAQLIHTFQTEGLRGVEGLAKMQHSGLFLSEKEKERDRVYELERGMIHDMQSMRGEYEGKLDSMQDEYRLRLSWLANQQATLEAHQAQQQQGLVRGQPYQFPGSASGSSPSARGGGGGGLRRTMSVGASSAPYGRASAASGGAGGGGASGPYSEHGGTARSFGGSTYGSVPAKQATRLL